MLVRFLSVGWRGKLNASPSLALALPDVGGGAAYEYGGRDGDALLTGGYALEADRCGSECR